MSFTTVHLYTTVHFNDGDPNNSCMLMTYSSNSDITNTTTKGFKTWLSSLL